jgi:hypothetical protein
MSKIETKSLAPCFFNGYLLYSIQIVLCKNNKFTKRKLTMKQAKKEKSGETVLLSEDEQRELDRG